MGRHHRRAGLIAALLVLALGVSHITTARSSYAAPRSPSHGSGACGVAHLEIWTGQEAWVWDQVCRGQVADFSADEGYYPDPAFPSDWDEDRILSSEFLQT